MQASFRLQQCRLQRLRHSLEKPLPPLILRMRLSLQFLSASSRVVQFPSHAAWFIVVSIWQDDLFLVIFFGFDMAAISFHISAAPAGHHFHAFGHSFRL